MFFLACEFSDFWYVLFFFGVSFKYGSFFLENWTGILKRTNLVFEDSGVNVQTFQIHRGKKWNTRKIEIDWTQYKKEVGL